MMNPTRGDSEIRQFRAEDAQSCSDLIQACIARDPQLSAAVREKLLRAESPEIMSRRAKLFYMAVQDSEKGILGVGGLDLNEVRLLYVLPDYQGKGVGSALLAHLESMVPPSLFADVFVYSTFGAVDFYRSRGFAAGGEFAFDFEGEQLLTVFMTKRIR